MIQKNSVGDSQRAAWENALQEVCELKGLDLPRLEDGHEARNICNIVTQILSKLDRLKLYVPPNVVGLDTRAQKVNALMANKQPRDVCIIGICGMGGIGKTTIAQRVYNLVSDKFEGSCFLEGVREKFEKLGVTKLQRQLLSQTLKREYKKIYSGAEGLSHIMEKLYSKRVLVVLDDVNDVDQVHNLLGDVVRLCSGSTVIITTREMDLLPFASYQQYKVHELNLEEAMQLFSFHAFTKSYSPKDYENYALRAVKYAGGIPLALQVLGSSLRGRSIDVWTSRLQKLDVHGDDKIHKILQISYDLLEDLHQLLFLDIACFFVGEDIDYVNSILEGCGMHPQYGIDTLRRRSLLNIGSYKMGSETVNKILMHDLVRDMGRKIVRQESLLYPEERSRIWLHQDANKVLRSQTGTKLVQGLTLNQNGPSEAFNTESFREMKNLRLLRLNYAHLSGSFECISKNLRWLCWKGFPMESIPSDLDLRNLVVLDMQYSRLTMFSKDIKILEQLRVLDLSYSKRLIESPRFDHMSCLEKLVLAHCISLEEVHKSIGLLTKLVCLNLEGCKSLKKLPKTIHSLTSLEKLNLRGCKRVQKLPKKLGSITSLVELIADETAIRSLPKSLANLLELNRLSLEKCPHMFSPESCALISRSLPAFLKVLNLRYCGLTDNSFPHDLHALASLKVLILNGNKFTNFAASIGSRSESVWLYLDECRSLKSVTVNQPGHLQLHLHNCQRLKAIDLTKSARTVLELQSCHQLAEIKGYLTLEGSEANLHVFDTLPNSDLKKAFCQSGTFNLFDVRNEVPSWFWQRKEGDSISFTVPPPEPNSKVAGFITCAIYLVHWPEPNSKAGSCLVNKTTLVNKTKKLDWIHDSCFKHLKILVGVNEWLSYWMYGNMLLSYWMFENLTEKGSNFNSVCRFWKEMEEGDEIDFSITFPGGVIQKVVKCGLHIIYEYHNNEPGFFRVAGSSWDSAATHSFQQLKETLTTIPVLRMPVFTKPFVVETGTSNVGIDAVLMQEDGPIAYLTRELSARHRHYTVVDKELLAIVMAVEKWHHYLVGRVFVVRMDYRIVQYLMEQEVATPLQQKWLAKLVGYDFIISCKQIKESATSAALSRLVRVKLLRLTFFGKGMELMQQIKVSWIDLHVRRLINCWWRDPHFGWLIENFEEGMVTDSPHSWSNGLLRRKGKLVVAKDLPLRRKIIKWSHISPAGGHSSIQATVKEVASLFFWKGRENDVRNFIKACDVCQQKQKVAEHELTASIIPEPIQLVQNPTPYAILGRRMVKRGRVATATQVLVQWANSSRDQASWEYLYDLQKRFPEFEDNVIEVEGGTDPGNVIEQDNVH